MAIAQVAIGIYLILRFGLEMTGTVLSFPSLRIPLLVALASSIPLVIHMLIKLSRLEFSPDLLAGN